MYKYITQIPKILTSKQNFFLFGLFIFTILMNFIELLGLGSLVALVSIINDPISTIEKLNSFNINLSIDSLKKEDLILLSSLFLIIIFTFKAIISFFFNYFSAKLTVNINHTISSTFFKKYIYKKYEDLRDLTSTKFINDIKDETTRFITFIFALLNIVKDFFFITLILLTLLVTSPSIAIFIFLIILILSGFIYFVLKKKVRKIGEDRTKFNKRIYKILNDSYSGIKNIKLIGAENIISLNFDRFNNNFLNNILQMRIINPLPRIFLEWFVILGVSLLIIYMNQSTIGLNNFLPLLTFVALSSIRLVPAFAAINQNINHLNWNLNATALIIKEVTEKRNIKRKINISKKINIKNLEIQNLSYQHKKNNHLTLKNISLKAKKNELIGIIGTSGSGKTTLVETILGLNSIQNGSIKINNKKNIINSKEFKNSISYVSQDIFLFEGTILDNITFGLNSKGYDKDLLIKALKISEIYKFTQKNRLGINYVLNEEGTNISGGERQRIAIARAIYRSSELIVFDEATSSLDQLTEKKIIQNLNDFKKDKIIFMITHRLETLKNCNKLIIIDDGKIINFGKTKNILEKYNNLQKFIKIKK